MPHSLSAGEGVEFMTSADVVLKLEIVEGRVPDAETVAHALLAWIELLKIGGSILDPHTELTIGLAGVADGSDIFRFSIFARRAENIAEQIVAGSSDYPLVSKAVLSLAGMIGGTILVTTLGDALTPDPRIPDDQMAVFEEQKELLAQSVELQRQQMRFYGILAREPAFERIDVIRPFDERTIYSIPSDQFAERSGVWGDEVVPTTTTRPKTATWDVVLLRATLVNEPTRWRFVREGLEFSARMEDRLFLDALHNKTLPIQMAEGIEMRIEVSYREAMNGSAWLPVPGSHRVVRVLSPLPPAPTVPLFPNSSAP